MRNLMKDDESPVNILWLPTIFMAAVAYIVSFIDLIPGIGPISWIDDIVVAFALVWFVTSWIPKNRHRIYWFRPKTRSGPKFDETGRAGRTEGVGSASFDPLEVLGVRRGASPDAIRSAYREMLSKYHPDKVSHLGEEFQKMAHEKVIDIKKAYEALGGRG